MHTLQRNLNGNLSHNTAKGLSQEGETFFDLFMRFSIVGWCTVHRSLKITTEMRVGRIMKIFGDIGDGSVCFQEYFCRVLHL